MRLSRRRFIQGVAAALITANVALTRFESPEESKGKWVSARQFEANLREAREVRDSVGFLETWKEIK